MTALQILMGIYVVISLINILIAAIQYYNDKNPVQKTILIYWISNFIIIGANGLFLENDMKVITIATLGIFFTNLLLGSFFAKIHRVTVPIKPLFVFYICCYLISWLFFYLGASFTYYGIFSLIGCVTPLGFHIYKVLKNKKRNLTITQKIFAGLSIFMILHWLDAAFVRLSPELYFFGNCIALAILQILSILTPMMGTEHTLQLRNELLEEEVKQKVKKLTEVEMSLWEANKLASLGQLSGGVAHEINNPLQIITLYTEALKIQAENGVVSAGDVISKTTRIENMIERISEITNSLRKIARDHRTIKMQKNDLIQIIKETVLLCHDKIVTKNINLKLNFPLDHLFIECNSIEISQVILNLLNNSIDAVECLEKKEIVLSIIETRTASETKDEYFIELKIEDSGQIPDHVVPHLMEPFFTTKPQGRGTGLGLSIAKSIIENHGAKLYYDKTKLNTTFVIEFHSLMILESINPI